MPVKTRMVTSDEAKSAKRQHKTPCKDCPFRRDSIPGWLGGHMSTDFILMAQGEVVYPCHVHKGAQCAGMAIYRANTCKSPRNPEAMRLPADRKLVFDWAAQFMEHHGYPEGEEDGED